MGGEASSLGHEGSYKAVGPRRIARSNACQKVLAQQQKRPHDRSALQLDFGRGALGEQMGHRSPRRLSITHGHDVSREDPICGKGHVRLVFFLSEGKSEAVQGPQAR